MQKVTGIGGVFFKAKNLIALSKWYEDVLGVDINDKTWEQEPGQTVFAPFKVDSDYFGRADQRWMICFRVSDLKSFIAQLEATEYFHCKEANQRPISPIACTAQEWASKRATHRIHNSIRPLS